MSMSFLEICGCIFLIYIYYKIGNFLADFTWQAWGHGNIYGKWHKFLFPVEEYFYRQDKKERGFDFSIINFFWDRGVEERYKKLVIVLWVFYALYNILVVIVMWLIYPKKAFKLFFVS